MAMRASRTPVKTGTPKRSPLRGMSVEAWMGAKVPADQRELVRALILMAQEAAPTARVCIKWGHPVFESNGPIAYIKPAKAHVTFGFWRGSDLKDPKGKLEGGAGMRHVKIRARDEINASGLGSFMRAAAALDRARGAAPKAKT